MVSRCQGPTASPPICDDMAQMFVLFRVTQKIEQLQEVALLYMGRLCVSERSL